MFSSFKMTLSLLFYLSFFALFSPSSASRTQSSESEKVSFDLYYESLCPDSVDFIVNYLPKLFKDDLMSIVDLKLVPSGNVKVKDNHTINCQHGPYECLLNTVEACAINAWPEVDRHFSFIYCIETLVLEHMSHEWESCFQKLGLNPKPVVDCYKGALGEELELKYAAETDALEPPHRFVPWVVVNGKPLYDDYETFEREVCKVYKGTPLPKACTQAHLNDTQIGEAKPKHSVRYKQGVMSTLLEKLRSTIASWMDQMNLAAQV